MTESLPTICASFVFHEVLGERMVKLLYYIEKPTYLEEDFRRESICQRNESCGPVDFFPEG